MDHTIAAALRAYGATANKAAASAPARTYFLCRPCDIQWTGEPVCWNCGGPAHREPGESLWDPVKSGEVNIGIPHTRYETVGLGGV
jgi:hypothetical protein